jgi:hypothetical protein
MRHSIYGDGRVFDRVPVYRLLEDVPEDERSISGRAGDILIGGGSGETAALSFRIPGIFSYYTDNGDFEEHPVRSHWSEDDAFILGTGFERSGWNPGQQPLLVWLAEHLMAFLVRTFPDRYASLVGEFPPEQDGSIFANAPLGDPPL